MSGRTHPALATAGLLVGLVVATGDDLVAVLLRHTPPAALRLAGLGTVALALGTGVVLLPGRVPIRPILSSRANLDSPGRFHALHAAGALIAEHPLTGTGVGLARFVWPDGTGNLQIGLYAHNEYLQTLVDLGAVGALLLLVVLVMLVRTVWRGRPRPPRPGLWAGTAAALTALAVHSGFDFLWHLAVLPLLGGLLVGLVAPVHSEEPSIPDAPASVRPSHHEEEHML